MAKERRDAAEAATAAATAAYASPFSAMTASELRQEYEDVAGQRKCEIIKQCHFYKEGKETKYNTTFL